MKDKKIIAGVVASITGFILFVLVMDLISKPSNMPLSFNPVESLSGFFFAFVFTLGDIGWFLGGLLLLGIVSLCYFLGTWIYKVLFSNK